MCLVGYMHHLEVDKLLHMVMGQIVNGNIANLSVKNMHHLVMGQIVNSNVANLSVKLGLSSSTMLQKADGIAENGNSIIFQYYR
ncbi:hypothetical protein [Helcococcus ovis]|uniref:hypothetical protein n=3 Tax=Helcococcus ovis TaxID=72026 RepID=UPI0038B7F07B